MPNPTTTTPAGELSGVDPLGTAPLFDLADLDPARSVFAWCWLCIDAVVDEPGELCPDCASAVLTGRADPTTGTTTPAHTCRRWSR